MGKTQRLHRSKKVVKPKRTRSCVSKKNGKKTHKKRHRSRKKRGGRCDQYYYFGYVKEAIKCKYDKIKKLKEKCKTECTTYDKEKLVEKTQNLIKMLTTEQDELQRQMNVINEAYAKRHIEFKKEVTIDNFHQLPSTNYTTYGEESKLNNQINELIKQIDALKTEIAELESKRQIDNTPSLGEN
jgi:hypothetical protein